MLSFVRRSRRVAVAFFTVLALSTVSFNFDVLLPLVARRTLDADADVFGLIAAVFGAGALCGAIFLATLGKASLRMLLAGAGGFGVLELALAPQHQPQHLRGQAASLYYFAFMGGAPLGGLLAGWLTAQGGTKLAFAVAGTSAVLVAIAGTAALFGLKPRTTRIEGDWNADHAQLHALPVWSRHTRCHAARGDLRPLLGRCDP